MEHGPHLTDAVLGKALRLELPEEPLEVPRRQVRQPAAVNAVADLEVPHALIPALGGGGEVAPTVELPPLDGVVDRGVGPPAYDATLDRPGFRRDLGQTALVLRYQLVELRLGVPAGAIHRLGLVEWTTRPCSSRSRYTRSCQEPLGFWRMLPAIQHLRIQHWLDRLVGCDGYADMASDQSLYWCAPWDSNPEPAD